MNSLLLSLDGHGKKIIRLVEEKGPLTGSEIYDAVGGDGLVLWRACRLSKALSIRTLGRRYLRLDSRVEGFARLSPSIFREFLTYSVIGFAADPGPLTSKADHLDQAHRRGKQGQMPIGLQHRLVRGKSI